MAIYSKIYKWIWILNSKTSTNKIIIYIKNIEYIKNKIKINNITSKCENRFKGGEFFAE